MSVRIRDRGSRGVYLRVSTPGRKPFERYCGMGAKGMAEAVRLKAELEQAQSDERLWHSEDRPLPIDAMVRSWRDGHTGTHAWRTRQTAEARVERLARWFGPRDLRSLTEGDLREAATAWLTEGLSGWTVAGVLSTLRSVYNLAVREGLFAPRRPLQFGQVIQAARRRTEVEAPTRDAWTSEEMNALLEVARKYERMGPILAFLFATGARRGEALGLQWADVDFVRGFIHIRRVPTGEGRGKTKAPKTERANRLIPMTPTLRAMLTELRGSRLPTHWVFCDAGGQEWLEGSFASAWVRLRRRAQVRGVRPLPLHCTRHTAITQWLTRGVSLQRVCEWSGDAVSTIQRHYAHVLPLDFEPPDLLAASPRAAGGNRGEAVPQAGASAKDSERVADSAGVRGAGRK